MLASLVLEFPTTTSVKDGRYVVRTCIVKAGPQVSPPGCGLEAKVPAERPWSVDSLRSLDKSVSEVPELSLSALGDELEEERRVVGLLGRAEEEHPGPQRPAAPEGPRGVARPAALAGGPRCGESSEIDRFIPRDPREEEEEQAADMGMDFHKAYDAETVVLNIEGDRLEVPSLKTYEEAVEKLGFPPFLRASLAERGYYRLTPVQEATMPLMGARADFLASSFTGSGKTAAYLLPILAALEKLSRLRPGALVAAHYKLRDGRRSTQLGVAHVRGLRDDDVALEFERDSGERHRQFVPVEWVMGSPDPQPPALELAPRGHGGHVAREAPSCAGGLVQVRKQPLVAPQRNKTGCCALSTAPECHGDSYSPFGAAAPAKRVDAGTGGLNQAGLERSPLLDSGDRSGSSALRGVGAPRPPRGLRAAHRGGCGVPCLRGPTPPELTAPRATGEAAGEAAGEEPLGQGAPQQGGDDGQAQAWAARDCALLEWSDWSDCGRLRSSRHGRCPDCYCAESPACPPRGSPSAVAAAIEIIASMPDGDVYLEVNGSSDPNVAAMRWSDARQPPPPGVPRGSWRFRWDVTSAEQREFQRLAKIAARDVYVARDRRAGGPSMKPAGGALHPLAADPARAPLPAPRSGELVWVVSESQRGLQRGMVVFLGAGVPMVGDVGMYQVPGAPPGPRGPAAVSVRRMLFGGPLDFMRNASGADVRVMPVEARRAWRRRTRRRESTDAAADEPASTLNGMRWAPRGGSPRPAKDSLFTAFDSARWTWGRPPVDLDGPRAFDELGSKLACDGSSSRLALLRVELLGEALPGFRSAALGEGVPRVPRASWSIRGAGFSKRLQAAHLPPARGGRVSSASGASRLVQGSALILSAPRCRGAGFPAPQARRAPCVEQAPLGPDVSAADALVSVGGDAFGWRFAEGGMCSMSLRSAWRFRLALQGVAKIGGASGREISALLGRFATRGLVRRSVLSAPQAEVVLRGCFGDEQLGDLADDRRSLAPAADGRGRPASGCPPAPAGAAACEWPLRGAIAEVVFGAVGVRQWLRAARLRDLAAAVVKMFDLMFGGGWRTNAASKVVAAIACFRPAAGPGLSQLPRAQPARRGFARPGPPQAGLPSPWAVKCQGARMPSAVGSWRTGAAVLFAFVRYFGPCELLGIRACDLVPPSRRGRCAGLKWAVMLGSQQMQITFNMGARDETALVDNVDQLPFIDALLAQLRANGGQSLEFPFSYREWAVSFEAVSKSVGLAGEMTPLAAEAAEQSVSVWLLWN
ncbi:unnamed protein product [Prorocentrum cordatum]|uniref:RNA helicase n=1 Tax=Prorocentrum cordatum TaxID=2364126 RepID=A0ABN9PIZ9_9DINO|nr:unnamed protein product [Polarella glacialis]